MPQAFDLAHLDRAAFYIYHRCKQAAAMSGHPVLHDVRSDRALAALLSPPPLLSRQMYCQSEFRQRQMIQFADLHQLPGWLKRSV